MKPREFFDLVCKMRAAQKEYFKTRRKSALSLSKHLESQVDAEISRVERLLGISAAIPQQRSIFDHPEKEMPENRGL